MNLKMEVQHNMKLFLLKKKTNIKKIPIKMILG